MRSFGSRTIAERIAEEIEREDSEADRDAGKDRHPGRALSVSVRPVAGDLVQLVAAGGERVVREHGPADGVDDRDLGERLGALPAVERESERSAGRGSSLLLHDGRIRCDDRKRDVTRLLAGATRADAPARRSTPNAG
ncbi:MAG: hypothetical protein HYU41_03285 [Candidatus Rokubacteria bacterium]|nr:hypothetical protein [Candidatus Rokubacteria bacterium]